MRHLEFILCTNCEKVYDTNNHIPRIIPICGHSICHGCLTKGFSRTMRCPIDKTSFRHLKISSFPKNFFITDLLGQNAKNNACKLHSDQKIQLVQLAADLKSCSRCLPFLIGFMAQLEAPECPICYEIYDLANHCPITIPSCGHNVCRTCLSKLPNRNRRCPFDNKSISSNINSFPINYGLMKFLEGKNETVQVPMDNKTICASCILDSHKDHELELRIQRTLRYMKILEPLLLGSLFAIAVWCVLLILYQSPFIKLIAQTAVFPALQFIGSLILYITRAVWEWAISPLLELIAKFMISFLLLAKETTVFLFYLILEGISFITEWFISTGLTNIASTISWIFWSLKEMVGWIIYGIYWSFYFTIEWIILPTLGFMGDTVIVPLWVIKELTVWACFFCWKVACFLIESVIFPLLSFSTDILLLLLWVAKDIMIWALYLLWKVISYLTGPFISIGLEFIGIAIMEIIILLKEIVSFVISTLWKSTCLAVDWIVFPASTALGTTVSWLFWFIKNITIWLSLGLCRFIYFLFEWILIPAFIFIGTVILELVISLFKKIFM